MHKLYRAKITWPVMYQMFGLLYLHKDLFLQQLDTVRATTEYSVNNKHNLTGYEKVYYLLAHRAKELRLFLYKVGAKQAASAIHTYIVLSKTHSEQKAFRHMLSSKQFNLSLGNVLALALVMDTSDLDWRCAVVSIKGYNHLVVTKNHVPVAQINIDSFDTKWIKYREIKSLIQKELKW